jgi:hypothetical protein
LYVEKNGKVGDIIPTLNTMAGFEKDTPLMLFEVRKLSRDSIDDDCCWLTLKNDDGNSGN